MAEHDDKIIHRELSYRLNGCIFDVHNEVGPGLREECYQKAMECRLRLANIAFVAKPKTRGELIRHGRIVDVFEPDLLIPERMVVELKHQPEGLARENYTQVLSYLKFWNLPLGLLANFAMQRAVIERIPYEVRRAELREDYSYIRKLVRQEDRQSLNAIRDCLVVLNEEIGAGYADRTYRNLAIVEFQSRGLKCDTEIEVIPFFRARRLPRSPITPILVDDRFCVQIEAIRDEISARAVRTMQTHLRLTGCEIGIIACFGKTNFTIQGVRQ